MPPDHQPANDRQPPTPTPPARLPDDVVVGRVLRALTRMMWLLTGAAIVLGFAAMALAAAKPDGTLELGIMVLLVGAGLALLGAGIALGAALAARDAQQAVRWIARAYQALRAWGWGVIAALCVAVAVGSAITHPSTSGVVGAILAALVACQIVPLAAAARRRWPQMLQP